MTDPIGGRRALIAALLGPAEPELTCEECFDQLDRYVDLGLAATDAATDAGTDAVVDADRAVPGMRAHLVGCPACREDHDSLRDLLRADADRAAAQLGDVH